MLTRVSWAARGRLMPGNADVRALSLGGGITMRTTLCTLMAAAMLALGQLAAAGDEPATAQPGRALDADSVKAGAPTARPGRTVEVDPEMALSDRDRPGRAIDEGTVKSQPDPQRPGRAAQEE